MDLVANCICFPAVQFFENRLRFDKVTDSKMVGTFLRHSVDAAYCYRPSSVVCRSVCRSVTLMSPAKWLKRWICRLRWGFRWAQGTMY